jgi:hypothetical protein
MKLPVLFGDNFISVNKFGNFDIFFLLNSIQIFMELVKNPSKKFLAVMLGITFKHGVRFADCTFQP